jgi:hypothetical protein
MALYGYDPDVGALPTVPASTSPSVTEIIDKRALHLEAVKEHLAKAQNKMKLQADQKRLDCQFSVGD